MPTITKQTTYPRGTIHPYISVSIVSNGLPCDVVQSTTSKHRKAVNMDRDTVENASCRSSSYSGWLSHGVVPMRFVTKTAITYTMKNNSTTAQASVRSPMRSPFTMKASSLMIRILKSRINLVSRVSRTTRTIVNDSVMVSPLESTPPTKFITQSITANATMTASKLFHCHSFPAKCCRHPLARSRMTISRRKNMVNNVSSTTTAGWRASAGSAWTPMSTPLNTITRATIGSMKSKVSADSGGAARWSTWTHMSSAIRQLISVLRSVLRTLDSSSSSSAPRAFRNSPGSARSASTSWWKEIVACDGEGVPTERTEFSLLVLVGGRMSPHIRQNCESIKRVLPQTQTFESEARTSLRRRTSMASSARSNSSKLST
mmetsp:Transcript_69200/g.192680  ORF Transcript_69200/g.192680 Transcript_69200/m.192680 type:complete len:374 (-) Transcript_69200:241-1362(-)